LAVLAEWGSNFVSHRYPYERYENLTENEYRALGRAWVDNGASLEDAAFRYHPEELFGFIYAIRRVANEARKAGKSVARHHLADRFRGVGSISRTR